jgi:hypothetical protein
MDSDKGKFLRTVLRNDVHQRLTELAQSFSTGRNDWDYGVAIQFLLDFHEQNTSVGQLHAKMDAIAHHLENLNNPQDIKQDEEKEYVELLGGEKLEK